MAKKKFRGKKILFIILAAVILSALLGYFLQREMSKEKEEILSRQTQRKNAEIPLTLPNGQIIDVAVGKRKYKVLAIKIRAGERFTLIPNFKEKIIPDTLVSENNCLAAVNGGFYREDETPLGLMVVNGETIGKQAQSRTANSYFWQDYNYNLDFAKDLPPNTSNLEFIFQTGPIIAVRPRKLSTVNDEYARRSLIGRDLDNNYYLLSVISAENSYSGPLLSEIPLIFSKSEVKNEAEFTQVLNLDGGSASFYYSTDGQETLTLSALSPVGSILCLQK